jgi:hypothetical protein
MTKTQYLRQFKFRLERIVDNTNLALDEIQNYEDDGGDFSEFRDEIECLAMDIAKDAGELDRLGFDSVEDEECQSK